MSGYRTNRRTFLASFAGALLLRLQARQDDWQGIARVVAIGDVHGDKDALASVLRMAGVMDANERWIGGATHVVQLGDVPSRGPQTRKALDLLMRLEPQALDAGGKLHALIGNHDSGVIIGDLRSVLPEEYEEFRTADSEDRLRKAYQDDVALLRKQNALPSDIESFRTSWFDRHPPGWVEHREAFAPNGRYGSWIRRNKVVIRINDSLFVHGGISPKYASTSRATLNAAIQQELANFAGQLPPMCMELAGPLLYRGLSDEEVAAPLSHVDSVLNNHRVRRVIVGHTVTQTAILPRYDGRVIDVDIGLSRFYGRPPACLVQEGRDLHVLHRGVRIPFPGPGRVEYREYLRAVEAADEKPSPVTRMLERL